jgi:hypothetical protein
MLIIPKSWVTVLRNAGSIIFPDHEFPTILNGQVHEAEIMKGPLVNPILPFNRQDVAERCEATL